MKPTIESVESARFLHSREINHLNTVFNGNCLYAPGFILDAAHDSLLISTNDSGAVQDLILAHSALRSRLEEPGALDPFSDTITKWQKFRILAGRDEFAVRQLLWKKAVPLLSAHILPEEITNIN